MAKARVAKSSIQSGNKMFTFFDDTKKKKKVPERKEFLSEGLSEASMKKFILPHETHVLKMDVTHEGDVTYVHIDCMLCGVTLCGLDTEGCN